jgi:hypothetical protein
MAVKTANNMSPSDLKTLFEALNIAPAWISKRFILKYYCAWTDQDIQDNANQRLEEEQQAKIGNKTGAFR